VKRTLNTVVFLVVAYFTLVANEWMPWLWPDPRPPLCSEEFTQAFLDLKSGETLIRPIEPCRLVSPKTQRDIFCNKDDCSFYLEETN
jgi:hypothetical protein